jgi:hypothetical protein
MELKICSDCGFKGRSAAWSPQGLGPFISKKEIKRRTYTYLPAFWRSWGVVSGNILMVFLSSSCRDTVVFGVFELLLLRNEQKRHTKKFTKNKSTYLPHLVSKKVHENRPWRAHFHRTCLIEKRQKNPITKGFTPKVPNSR